MSLNWKGNLSLLSPHLWGRDPLVGLQAVIQRELSDREPIADGAVSGGKPPMDLVETMQGFVVSMDLPGWKPGELHIEVRRDVVTIQGRVSGENGDAVLNSYRRERRRSPFLREVELPFEIREGSAVATLNLGVLKIFFPRGQSELPRSIPVQSGNHAP
ncbi:MAG: Hsp20/alpha crystallin family protein [Planctomycetaceae bacterium]